MQRRQQGSEAGDGTSKMRAKKIIRNGNEGGKCGGVKPLLDKGSMPRMCFDARATTQACADCLLPSFSSEFRPISGANHHRHAHVQPHVFHPHVRQPEPIQGASPNTPRTKTTPLASLDASKGRQAHRDHRVEHQAYNHVYGSNKLSFINLSTETHMRIAAQLLPRWPTQKKHLS